MTTLIARPEPIAPARWFFIQSTPTLAVIRPRINATANDTDVFHFMMTSTHHSSPRTPITTLPALRLYPHRRLAGDLVRSYESDRLHTQFAPRRRHLHFQ